MHVPASGHSHLEKFCGHMNMPPPTRNDNYTSKSDFLTKAYRSVAEITMSDAANALHGPNKTAYIGVSIDGAWQRKGYTSKLDEPCTESRQPWN